MTRERGFWAMRDLPTVGWLFAAVVAALAHSALPSARWLLIHLLVLGAAGHAILVWSRYFADSLLHSGPAPRVQQTRRLVGFNIGVLAVVAGVPGHWWGVVVAGGLLAAGAVLWHCLVLAGQLRSARSARFAPSVRFYVAAGLLFPLGALLGVLLAGDAAGSSYDRLRVAHLALNVLGWIGLTVLGTLVTLWPSMLRTRIDPGSERAARLALPGLAASVLAVALLALVGPPWAVGLGLLGYLVGLALMLAPMLRTLLSRRPASFASWSVLAGVCWLAGCVVVLALTLGTTHAWAGASAAVDRVAPLLAVGFTAQVLIGALSYLVPVVLGGGARPVRAANAVLDRATAARVGAAQAGLLLGALPVPSWWRLPATVVALVALASFLPLLLMALRASRRAKADPQSR